MDIQHRIGGAPGVPQFKVGLVTAATKAAEEASCLFRFLCRCFRQRRRKRVWSYMTLMDEDEISLILVAVCKANIRKT